MKVFFTFIICLLLLLNLNVFGQNVEVQFETEKDTLKVFVTEKAQILVNEQPTTLRELDALLAEKDPQNTIAYFAKKSPKKQNINHLKTIVAVPDLFKKYRIDWRLFKDATYTE